jgi:hypothetical protein
VFFNKLIPKFQLSGRGIGVRRPLYHWCSRCYMFSTYDLGIDLQSIIGNDVNGTSKDAKGDLFIDLLIIVVAMYVLAICARLWCISG